MTEADVQVSFIKQKELETNLNALLNSYTKVQLVEIAENLNAPTKKSWRKSKLVTGVEESIIEQATTVYEALIEDILTHFPESDTQVYRLNTLEDVKSFVPLIKKGFFFVSKDKNDTIFIIPDEIKERVQISTDTSTEEVTTESSDKSKVLNKWKETQLAIYGSYSAAHLRQVWNQYFNDNLTDDEINSLLD